jgi:hypothetical protein
MDLEDLLRFARICKPSIRTHYSILLDRGRVVSVGEENRAKTHPLAAKKGYKYPTIHSELSALINIDKDVDPRDCTLVNLRISPTGNIGMSRPCKYCIGWCCETFKDIWYTNENGVLVRL